MYDHLSNMRRDIRKIKIIPKHHEHIHVQTNCNDVVGQWHPYKCTCSLSDFDKEQVQKEQKCF